MSQVQSQIQQLLQAHPHWPAVEKIYHTLLAHGYKAFLAGGCVRDALLNIPANDLDVATDATPDQIEQIFAKTVNVGKSFGVMRVLVDGADIEVATFRTDGDYKDGRRPEQVHFSSPQEDAQRRDFTVNALFYDLSSQKVLDYVQGEADLHRKILRTVGDPEQRFKEDHLRLLRAARFVAQLDFVLEKNSFQALQKMASLVKTVSGERLRDEMGKLLKSKSVPLGLQVMETSGLLSILFPFRLQDNSWPASYGASEIWQYLALFYRKASQNDVRESFSFLRLSVKEQKALEKAWELWQAPEKFLQLNLGKQLQKLTEEGTLWALEVLLKEQSPSAPEIKKILEEWNQRGHQLPRPFLSGDDLKGRLQGKNIGHCLAEAFELQLEKKINTRDEALQWLTTYLKRDSHG